jgi:endonuclease-3
MADDRAQLILQALKKTFPKREGTKPFGDPFRTLVMTIISQNTADRNTLKAFENLSNRFDIMPEVLANAETGQIEQCLKVAGLYRNKAKAIKQASRTIHSLYHGSLEPILSRPLEEARKTLLQLPGVGPKTADVVLLFASGKPTIPVDTHVNRVSKRLGLVPSNGNYEAVRTSLQALYHPKDYSNVHVLLILHGREYCRARTPSCTRCPVNQLCPSRVTWNKND